MKHLLLLLLLPAHVYAQQWTFKNGGQTNNGSVSVQSIDGSGGQALTQNPTGAAAKANQSAVTQAPTVTIQGVSKLPVVVGGSACNPAQDQAGIKSDNTQMYSCIAGVWAPMGSGVTQSGGRSQLWKALAGQQVRCYTGFVNPLGTTNDRHTYIDAMVDNNGTPYARFFHDYVARADVVGSWVAGTRLTLDNYNVTIDFGGLEVWQIQTTTETHYDIDSGGYVTREITNYATICVANWS